MQVLKQCFVCGSDGEGGDPLIDVVRESHRASEMDCFVQCSRCGVRGPFHRTSEGARFGWNGLCDEAERRQQAAVAVAVADALKIFGELATLPVRVAALEARIGRYATGI